MDDRLKEFIPEGIDDYIKAKLESGDAGVVAKTKKYISHEFKPEEVRQKIKQKDYANFELPLIVNFYPELSDLHEEIINEFIATRRRLISLLKGL